MESKKINICKAEIILKEIDRIHREKIEISNSNRKTLSVVFAVSALLFVLANFQDKNVVNYQAMVIIALPVIMNIVGYFFLVNVNTINVLTSFLVRLQNDLSKVNDYKDMVFYEKDVAKPLYEQPINFTKIFECKSPNPYSMLVIMIFLTVTAIYIISISNLLSVEMYLFLSKLWANILFYVFIVFYWVLIGHGIFILNRRKNILKGIIQKTPEITENWFKKREGKRGSV